MLSSFPRAVRLCALTGSLLLLAAPAVSAAPSPQVTVESLTPATALPDTPVTARLAVKSSTCFTVAVLGVGIRDAAGNNLDFPGAAANQRICPQGLTVTTGARSFPAGTYRMFGFYQEQGGAWKNLPEQVLTVAEPPLEVTADRLEPKSAEPDAPVAGQLTLHASKCFTAAVVGVGVRDAAGNNLDFPGAAANQRICPQGLTVRTGTRTFPAGTYRVFGFYQDQAGAWKNLPEQVLTVAERPLVVTADRLAPDGAVADAPVVGQLTLHASKCFTAAVVGVGVRDAAGNNLDFPGALTDRRICGEDVTVKTGTRAFKAGTYRMFGYYQDQAGAWHNLPEHVLTVTPSSTADPSAPVDGKKLVWRDEFDGPISPTKWNRATSSAYRYGNYNPDDDKLDRIDPDKVAVKDGAAVFSATASNFTLPNGRKAWDTGLITTEYTSERFMVKTGDYAETRILMPKEMGAWPALWTWHQGGSEIDSFEYHPDNPNLLELTNHVNPAQKFWNDHTAVKPGEWTTIGTYYGADSVDWYVNDVKVFSDRTGVGPRWSAYLILNLSLCSGDYHPSPKGPGTVSFASDYVRVYR
ncbi:glycoside hydrolase family 16 protein [Kitasatospora sp. NPDC004289]